MPIYEYECPKCYIGIELIQKLEDPVPLCFCEDGDPVSMIKKMSKNSFQLKGSGWERDGYSTKKVKEDK